MTVLEENIPNGLAMAAPGKHDPFPEPDPLVRRFADDTPVQARMAAKLERVTAAALEAWLRGRALLGTTKGTP